MLNFAVAKIRRTESVPSDINNPVDRPPEPPMFGTLPKAITKKVKEKNVYICFSLWNIQPGFALREKTNISFQLLYHLLLRNVKISSTVPICCRRFLKNSARLVSTQDHPPVMNQLDSSSNPSSTTSSTPSSPAPFQQSNPPSATPPPNPSPKGHRDCRFNFPGEAHVLTQLCTYLCMFDLDVSGLTPSPFTLNWIYSFRACLTMKTLPALLLFFFFFLRKSCLLLSAQTAVYLPRWVLVVLSCNFPCSLFSFLSVCFWGGFSSWWNHLFNCMIRLSANLLFTAFWRHLLEVVGNEGFLFLLRDFYELINKSPFFFTFSFRCFQSC